MSYVIREGKRYYKDDRTEMLSLDTATQALPPVDIQQA